MCSGEFFLFRGGCYKIGEAPGNEICTAAEGGRCTTCKTDTNYIFQNKAATVTLGNECILCSDATNRDGVMGVANCNKCTHTSNTGAATCSACQEGYFLDSGTCTKCADPCATCENAADRCTLCPEGKYLNGNTCVDGTSDSCGADSYADKRTWRCKACSEITGCNTCVYNDNLGGPICSTCSGSNMVKTEVDGTTTCIAAASCAVASQPGTHFLNKDNNGCILCSIITDQTEGNKGVANCKTCAKAASGSTPTCSACLEGYLFNTNDKTCTTKCADNCATCSEANNANKCSTCMAGFFLVGTKGEGQCVPCGDTTQGGIDGCAECTNEGSLKCTKCKPNYRENSVGTFSCTKFCEDPTACGGTAGACGAIVVGGDGNTKYYCSYCGKAGEVPINGICTTTKNGNDSGCTSHTCTSCTAGYFLYMGGCYSVSKEPGSLMCSKASTTPGVCETPNANSRYFAVPGAIASQQSVLGCGNPLGTTVGDSAYVGVEGCKTCTAPSEASNGAMASAKCTACDEGKALTGSGYGCVTCDIAGCSACRADNACEACSDGYRLEGEACVRTGGNLSTGIMAGISVTKSSPVPC